MLILSRRAGEAILIAGGIRVVVIATERGQVRLGIDAPPEVTILRQEIVDDITAGTVAAVATPEALAALGLRRPAPVQPAPRSRARSAASVGADQKTAPAASTATTTSPAVRKPKRKAAAAPAAESQADRS